MNSLDLSKILIIQTAFIGDVILITPLIRAARQLFPQAQIDVLVIPQTAGVLTNNPHLNHIYTFDKRGNKAIAFWRTARLLRQQRYDLAISPHSSMTTSWLMRAANIPNRLGYDRWRQAKSLTMKVPHSARELKVEKNLHLLSALSDKVFDRQTELFPGEEERKKADLLLRGLKKNGRRLVALAPGSVWNTKRWPADHYVQLAGGLAQNNIDIVFVGAPDEKALCDEIIAQSGIKAANLAGQTNLMESAAVAANCDLMICNDSGALHIANAMQTDVFAFFGPTVKKLGYYPFRENDRVFEISGLECRPCGSHGHDKCPLGHFRCMLDLKPEPVLKAALKHLEKQN